MGDWPFTKGRVALGSVSLIAVVLFGAACGSGIAGGAGAAAPSADVSGAANSSGRYGDAAAWLCDGDTALCGAQTTRIVLGTDAAPHRIATSVPAADCFIVHSPEGRSLPPGEVVRPLPTAKALATTCRVFAPNRAQTSAAAPSDESLDAFRHYVDHQNDGRPFIVVSDSPESAHMSRTILDEVRSRSELRSRFVVAIVPGATVDLAAALPFCTVLEHLRCVISAPITREPGVAADPVPGITSGWAGACVNPADIEGRPGLLPDWMVVDGTSTVDCDVLALVGAKIEAFGLTKTTDSR